MCEVTSGELNFNNFLWCLEIEGLILINVILGALPPAILNKVSEMPLVILLKAHEHIEVLLSVLLEIKESSFVLLLGVIGVTKVIQVIGILLLNHIDLSLVVLVLVVVELAGSVLKNVGLRSFGSKSHNLIDTAFSISA